VPELSDVFLTATLPTGYRRTAPPPGIGYLASVLSRADFSVTLLDPSPLGMSNEDVVQAAAREDPLMTGIYCCTMDRYEAFALASRIKAEVPETKLAMGGPHVTFVAEETLRRIGSIDVVVRGEGEVTIRKLADRLRTQGSLADVAGIAYKEAGKVVSNPARAPIDDLDSIPFPAYDLFPDLGLYAPQGIAGRRRSAVVMTSRGCPYHCSFCSSGPLWARCRARSAENVVDELEYLVSEHEVEFVKFYDDVFTLNRKRVQEICQGIIDRKLDIGFFILTRVDLVDIDTLRILRRAGCEQVQYGIESGSQEVVTGVRKGIDLGAAEKALSITKEAGINSYVFLMLGLKGETEHDIRKTMGFLARNAENIQDVETSVNSIYPGSPDYYECIEKGIFDEDIWFTYRNDDPLLYKDTPPYPSPIPLRRLEAYRRLIHLVKMGLKGRPIGETSMATLGFLRNHFTDPEELVLLGRGLKESFALRKLKRRSGR